MRKLTEKEAQMYKFICNFAVKNGYLPTIREIRDGMGYKSTSTIWTRFQRLELLGLIERVHIDGVRYKVKGLRYVYEG